jgi:predicted nuclease of predicted toxin-antitoxin system
LNSSHIFLADENIPLSVIKQLRKEGCKIISVAEEFKKSSDKKILELSSSNKWIIITFDKDFGELIYNQNCDNPFGIILLRVTPKSPDYILQILKWLLMQTSISFEGNFVIVNKDKVRTIKISDIK